MSTGPVHPSTHTGTRPPGRFQLGVLLVCVLTLGALLLSLSPHVLSSSELVRLRNAMLYDPRPAQPQWTPADRPSDFAVDTGPLPSMFAAIVHDQNLRVPGDDWASAQSIARYLLQGGKRHSEPIQAGLKRTHDLIVSEGRGYCGDYVDVFTGLAHTAGLSTRPWAFSFDGFGGHGHIFNEVWDGQGARWIALDIFNNTWFEDAQGQPMSAMALREALQLDRPMRLMRIRSDVRSGFVHESRHLSYYRKGLNEWYMWWGTAVFAYDQSSWVGWFAPLGRSAEQLAAVALGLLPKLRVLQLPVNESQRLALAGVRLRLQACMVLLPLVVLAWVVWRRAALSGAELSGAQRAI